MPSPHVDDDFVFIGRDKIDALPVQCSADQVYEARLVNLNISKIQVYRCVIFFSLIPFTHAGSGSYHESANPRPIVELHFEGNRHPQNRLQGGSNYGPAYLCSGVPTPECAACA